ncbi:MAG: hypothetical protein ACI350_04020 [Prevotella sp.]
MEPQVVERRITSIEGHNAHWGDYRMVFYYTQDKIDSAHVSGPSGQKKAVLRVSYGQSVVNFNVSDYVSQLPPDETTGLAPEDIPMSIQTLYQKNVSLAGAHRVTEVTEIIYGKKDTDVYDYHYEQKNMLRTLYEYDAAGKMIIARTPEPLTKLMYNYVDDFLQTVDHYEYADGDWQLAGQEQLDYSSDEQLQSISYNSLQQDGQTTTVKWIGHMPCEVTVKGQDGETLTTKYIYDEEGYITSISCSNGDWQTITYEQGNGNFFLLSSFDDMLRGLPCLE